MAMKQETIEKSLLVDGKVVRFNWTPDKFGLGGFALAPGLVIFHADSAADARDIIYAEMTAKSDS